MNPHCESRALSREQGVIQPPQHGHLVLFDMVMVSSLDLSASPEGRSLQCVTSAKSMWLPWTPQHGTESASLGN